MSNIHFLPPVYPTPTNLRCKSDGCQGLIVKLAGPGHACRSCGHVYSESDPPLNPIPVENPSRLLKDDLIDFSGLR